MGHDGRARRPYAGLTRVRHGAPRRIPPEPREETMQLTFAYLRYALSTLATVGFAFGGTPPAH